MTKLVETTQELANRLHDGVKKKLADYMEVDKSQLAKWEKQGALFIDGVMFIPRRPIKRNKK